MSQSDASRNHPLPLLWATAIAIAAIGTAIMYDAMPGINWTIWSSLAALGLLLFARERTAPALLVPVAIVIVVSAGASITTTEPVIALICLSVILYLAFAMLLSPDPRMERIRLTFAIPAPVVAFGSAVTETGRRALDALHLVRSDRARSIVRGVALALPVVIIFTLLLASADPVFAGLRDAIRNLLTSWEFIPRTIFFFALLTLALGAYGFAIRKESLPQAAPTPQTRWLGSTERLILLGSVTLLLWIFLAVQLSYLFGNLPSVPGSGMTFAEYARRGFAELTIVASASVILILISERYGVRDRRSLALTVTIALIVAVLFLLGSAFNRVVLYEQAYGFTTARLYAQAYMIVLILALAALAWETRGDVDSGRLFRRVGLIATAVFIVLVYWNHEGWIARKNIEHFATSGRLDTNYLARDLSSDAVPEIVRRLPSLPEPARSELRHALEKRYTGRGRFFDRQWYEWNYRRIEAKRSLDQLGISFASVQRETVTTSRTHPRTQP